jgi:hypothetical protein
MAFLKGLTSEEMEVRTMQLKEAPTWTKSWERDLVKHILSDVRLDKFPGGETPPLK